MRMRMARMVMLVALHVLLFSICAYAQLPIRTASSSLNSVPSLWGDLRPGSYAVGFRTIFRYDNFRTWKLTRSYDGKFSPDLKGRPVQINLWYPGAAGRSSTKMRFGDYVDQGAPEDFAELNALMEQRSRDDAAGSVPRNEIPALQSAEMDAHRDASPAKERFPVVLYFGGLNATRRSPLISSKRVCRYESRERSQLLYRPLMRAQSAK